MATVRMVWAEDDRGAIGKDGTLPWHIPSDLAHFKEQTLNSTMVMGRSTWESIGRPLPKRHSVVLTRQTDFDPGFAEVTVVHSLAELEALMHDELAAGRLVTVAGGSQLYKQLMPMATELSVTKVQGDFDGDTFMEPVNDQDFDLVDQRTASDGDYQLEFLTYKRQ